ncbi:MAG TPA: ribonuclease PH [Tepidisphaeraceae bacterium]|nr:ribonuclease PH [Tepidisphaeraceae bacterium]
MPTASRAADQLRPVTVTRHFTRTPAGSVLWQQGETVILATASVSRDLPPWFKEDRAGGWVTCEYVMLPSSTPSRKPWPKIGHTDSRGTEIQRIIGRTIRAAIDLSKIGPHTIALDCQVLQADGGTRTASICAAWVALVDAVAKLPREMPGGVLPARGGFGIANGESDYIPDPPPARFDASRYDPKRAIVEQLAAVSVGVVDGNVVLDLDYPLDSRAEVDLNVAYTANGRFVEVQGSAENGLGFDRAKMDAMLDLAVGGCRQLFAVQREALGQ